MALATIQPSGTFCMAITEAHAVIGAGCRPGNADGEAFRHVVNGDGGNDEGDIGLQAAAFHRLDMLNCGSGGRASAWRRRRPARRFAVCDSEGPRHVAGGHPRTAGTRSEKGAGGEHHAAGEAEHQGRQAFRRTAEHEDGEGAQAGRGAG